MATIETTMIWTLMCVILLHTITCTPVQRTATDCSGPDCIVEPNAYGDGGNLVNTKLLEIIAGSVTHSLPEITDLLMNIVHVHQNTTATALPSIVRASEDSKSLQASQNVLIENGTAATNSILSEMVKLMQHQRDMQERLYQLMQDQTDRQTRLLENATRSLQQVTSLLEDGAERQEEIFDGVISLLLSNESRVQQDNQPPPNTCISHLHSGEHTILPQNNELGSFPVVCDMDNFGGGWIVFQRRFDGSVDFDRVWDDYVSGFGNLDGEFWLGLNKLHVITSRGNHWELLVSLEDFYGNIKYAIYDNFRVGDGESLYRLELGSYSGSAGDSLRDPTFDIAGMQFTTKDRDHDRATRINCSIKYRSGWWHNACSNGNLNGLYLGQPAIGYEGMYWWNWKNSQEALKRSELSIRRI